MFTQNDPDRVRSQYSDQQRLFARADTRSGPLGFPKSARHAVGETMPLGRCRTVIPCNFGCLFSHLRAKPPTFPESETKWAYDARSWCSSGMACRFGSRFKLAGARRFSAEPPYNDQPACKPGSVWPAARTADVTTIPLVRRLPGASSNLPERQIRTDPGFLPRRSYSVLLPVGFAVPLPSPETRCALTAPFHPCRG